MWALWILLQTVDCSKDLWDAWATGDAWTGYFGTFACTGPEIGMTGVGLVVALTGAVSLYSWAQGNATPVLAWLALLAGVIVGSLPGPFTGPSVALITIGVILAGWGAYKWLSRDL